MTRTSYGPVTLLVDFGGVDGNAPLREIVGHHQELVDRRVLLDPLRAKHGFATLVERALSCLATLPSHARDPEATAVVVANCTGAAFGMAVCAAFAATGLPAPTLVLVDPVLVDRQEVYDWACYIAARFTSDADVKRQLSAAVLEGDGPLDVVVSAVTAVLRTTAIEYATAAGMSPVEIEAVGGQLVDRYAVWLTYLMSLTTFDLPTLRSELHVLASAGSHGHDGFLRASPNPHCVSSVSNVDPRSAEARHAFDLVLARVGGSASAMRPSPPRDHGPGCVGTPETDIGITPAAPRPAGTHARTTH